eukprot:COSAG01_NODE_23657_length_806_cov_4.094767_1_plen_91_part_00
MSVPTRLAAVVAVTSTAASTMAEEARISSGGVGVAWRVATPPRAQPSDRTHSCTEFSTTGRSIDQSIRRAMAHDRSKWLMAARRAAWLLL